MAAVRYAYVRNELSPGTAWSRGPKDVTGVPDFVTHWLAVLRPRIGQVSKKIDTASVLFYTGQ